MSVNVIMATYNNEREIGLAVASVLLQDYENFELVVVNDASTDTTPDILERFAAQDDRIILLHNERNLGRARSRNRAIEASQGDLIAILDADDIAMPHRLACQLAYMEAHRDVGILGGWTIRIDRDNRPLDLLVGPTGDADIRWQLRSLRMPFHHCTVMFRREALISAGLYDPRFTRSQDSHLCRRVIQKSKGAALPDWLLLYRIDPMEPPAELRARARWSTYASWDSLKHSPNVAGFMNLARFFVLSNLPTSVLSFLSGMKRLRVPPDEGQVEQVQEWLVRLTQTVSSMDSGNGDRGKGTHFSPQNGIA